MAYLEQAADPARKDEVTHVVIFGAGIIPMTVLPLEKVRRAEAAEDERQRNKDRNIKPPKPPRPNAHIGRLALGLG